MIRVRLEKGEISQPQDELAFGDKAHKLKVSPSRALSFGYRNLRPEDESLAEKVSSLNQEYAPIGFSPDLPLEA